MDRPLIASTLQLVGRIILENGGEAYRVEDSVERLGRALGLINTQVYSVPGSVIMTLVFEDGETCTQVVRCKKRSVHLEKVDMANRICREVAENHLTPAQALVQLTAIQQTQDTHPLYLTLLATAVSSAAFAVMFKGNALDALLAASTAALVRFILYLLEKRDRKEQVISNLLGGALTTLLPALLGALMGQSVSQAAIAGALMHLLPGVPMTCAVQDLLKGDINSGLGYAVNAALVAIYVAGGAMAASRLLLLL